MEISTILFVTEVNALMINISELLNINDSKGNDDRPNDKQ